MGGSANARSWHFSDMPRRPSDVCYRVQNGPRGYDRRLTQMTQRRLEPHVGANPLPRLF